MILIVSIILGLRISNFLSSLTTVDYEYNTIYTRNYKEDKFNDSLIGKTKYEIVKILGESFEKTKLDSFNAIIYTDKKDSIYIGIDFVGKRGINVKYLYVSFNSNFKVKMVMSDSFIVNEDSLKMLDKKGVLEKFGKPDKEMICDCDCEVWSYSQIKKGGHSGKRPDIFIRNLIFSREGELLKVVKLKGSTYDKYIGVCKEID